MRRQRCRKPLSSVARGTQDQKPPCKCKRGVTPSSRAGDGATNINRTSTSTVKNKRSYDPSSKCHPSSLHTERSARDKRSVSRKIHVSSSVSSQTSSKSHASKSLSERFLPRRPSKVPITFCSLPSSFVQTTPADTSIPLSQQHSPPPIVATSRFPPPAMKIQLRYLQHAQSTALRLPVEVNPNVTATSNVSNTPVSTRQSQPHSEGNCGSHKTLQLRSKIILHTSTGCASTRFRAISPESDTSCSLRQRTANKTLPPDPQS